MNKELRSVRKGLDAQVRKIETARIDAHSALAMGAFNNFIRPWCELNKVDFRAGMGTWSMRVAGGAGHDVWARWVNDPCRGEADSDRPPLGFADIADILEVAVDGYPLGSLMPDALYGPGKPTRTYD